jgi:predicted DNA-binding transcriptional regulator AlpA
MSEARMEQRAFGWAEQIAESGSEERTTLPTRGEARESLSTPPPAPRTRPRRERRASAPGAAMAVSKPAAVVAPEAPIRLDDELWDVHAAAKFLRRSVSWVYHRVEDGTLPVKRLAGWGVRFIPSELRAWVQDGGGRRGR